MMRAGAVALVLLLATAALGVVGADRSDDVNPGRKLKLFRFRRDPDTGRVRVRSRLLDIIVRPGESTNVRLGSFFNLRATDDNVGVQVGRNGSIVNVQTNDDVGVQVGPGGSLVSVQTNDNGVDVTAPGTTVSTGDGSTTVGTVGGFNLNSNPDGTVVTAGGGDLVGVQTSDAGTGVTVGPGGSVADVTSTGDGTIGTVGGGGVVGFQASDAGTAVTVGQGGGVADVASSGDGTAVTLGGGNVADIQAGGGDASVSVGPGGSVVDLQASDGGVSGTVGQGLPTPP